MLDEAPLLAMIRATHPDPKPRMVYADWLEERGLRTEDHIRTHVIAHQAEDWPRLMMADLWEREGRGMRADVVRLQCELAAGGDSLFHPNAHTDTFDGRLRINFLRSCQRDDCRGCALRRRLDVIINHPGTPNTNLFDRVLTDAWMFRGWRVRWNNSDPISGRDIVIHRGFVDVVFCSPEEWHGKVRCPNCLGTGTPDVYTETCPRCSGMGYFRSLCRTAEAYQPILNVRLFTHSYAGSEPAVEAAADIVAGARVTTDSTGRLVNAIDVDYTALALEAGNRGDLVRVRFLH